MRKPVRVKEIVATFRELTSRYETQISDSAGLRMGRPAALAHPLASKDVSDIL
jgi:hypothetical protein